MPASAPQKFAVVGAGPAGLAFATTAAQCGHQVTLYDSAAEIGGQFNLAKKIPGKQEFYETLRYFARQIKLTGVRLKLNTRVSADDLNSGDFDQVILASGIVPRTPNIEGIDSPKVLSYIDLINGAEVGSRVAVIGAGGMVLTSANFSPH